MKKLMIATIAGLCAAVTFGLESQVVGYNTLMHNESGTRAPIFGACFVPLASTSTSTELGEFTPADGEFACEVDYIQVINPTTLANDRTFTYVDKTTADMVAADNGEPAGTYDEFIGWWDADVGVFEDGGFVNSYPIIPGTGFMGAFENGSEITFTSKGSVPTTPRSILPNTDGTRAPIFANFLPRDITLGYLTPVDGEFACEVDYIQVINPTTLANDRTFTYVDKTTADLVAADNDEPAGTYDEFIGWWDADVGVFEDGGFVNSYPVGAGMAFMGAFENSSEITFQLPSATATLD